MTRAINPIKLKNAAEYLDWVLKQYSDSDDVQSLLRSLTPLIEDAKAGRVIAPVDRRDIPGAWNFGDGRYIPYTNPSVDNAYSDFSIELRGGLSEQDKQRIERMDAMRKVTSGDPQS